MKRKKMKLSLGKLTVANLEQEEQNKVQGGYLTIVLTNCCTAVSNCCTVGSLCCTINVATCIPDAQGCNPADTFGAGTICP